VGTYAITPILVDPDDRMANYQVESTSATLTVSPAHLTISSSSARMVLGQAIPAFTVSYDGFQLSDGPNVLAGTLTFSLPDGTPSQPGLFPVRPGGLSAANYTITYVDGYLNVVAPPAPPVTVQSVRWQTPSPGHKKTAKVVVVTFSAALNPGDAQDASAYHLISGRQGKKSDLRASKTIPIASAIYNPSAHTVTLTPRGKLANQALELSINTALVRDTHGRPIDGNQTGGSFLATISRL
jgi:hypothetical protein